MKTKSMIFLLPLLLLVGCGTPASESEPVKPSESFTPCETTKPSEETPLVTEPESTEEKPSETTTETPETKTYTMTKEHIPASAQSQYNVDFDFQVDDLNFHGDYLQQGSGSYDGTIQMKKEVSYLYSRFAFQGSVHVELMNKGEYTGTLSLYVGDSENPTRAAQEFERVETPDGTKYTFDANIDGYFSLKNESSFACYVYNIVLEGFVK